MLSLRTIRRPFTGNFQTAVRTVLPFHVTSRGRPAFTERRRGISTFSKFGAWLDSFYFTTVHSDGGTRHPFRARRHHEREQIGDLFRSSIATDPHFSGNCFVASSTLMLCTGAHFCMKERRRP